MRLSFLECVAVGVAGYAVSRVSTRLFPRDLSTDAADPTSRVQQVFSRINVVRNWARKRLDDFSLTPRGHFLATSLKDNLGFVLFILALSSRELSSAQPVNTQARVRQFVPGHPSEATDSRSEGGGGLIYAPTPLPESGAPPLRENMRRVGAASQRVAPGLANLVVRSYLTSRTKNVEETLTLATLAIVSCSILQLGRAATYRIGNRVLDRVQGNGVPSSTVTVARRILVQIAPSEL